MLKGLGGSSVSTISAGSGDVVSDGGGDTGTEAGSGLNGTSVFLGASFSAKQ